MAAEVKRRGPHSEAWNAAIAAGVRRRWQDPDYASRVTAAKRAEAETHWTPERRRQQGAVMRAMWRAYWRGWRDHERSQGE